MPEKLEKSLERFLSESEKIAQTFEVTLRDKKDLISDLILKLDRRLGDYRELLEVTRAAIAQSEQRLLELEGDIRQSLTAEAQNNQKANPAAPEVRALVLQLAKKGYSVEDIALRSKLHRGEVELIIDLEQQFSI
jgi:hypothetical protein